MVKVGFFKEATYTTWLANIVLVKKFNGKWRMCTHYTNLNKAYPKDTYPLLGIDKLVDDAVEHKVVNFLVAYFGYNHIPLYLYDKEEMTFIIEETNFYCEVMPFGLKNVRVRYQRLMDQVFHHLIGKCVEVYIDDMVVMSDSLKQHIKDFDEVFTTIHK